MIIEYQLNPECVNTDVRFSCLKCGQCGRVFRNGWLVMEHEVVSSKWIPKYGQAFWWIDDIGEPVREMWTGDPSDIYFWRTGNCYKTRKEAIESLRKEAHVQED